MEHLERRLTDWGLALWQALFPGGEQNAVYAGIRDQLHQAGPEPRRVLLRLASDQPDFLIRPWEMLRDPRGPLALRGLTLRRRLLRRDEGPAPAPAALPLRLLLIVSRPEDTGFIDPRTSTRPVLDALAGLVRCDPPQGVVDFCEPPTFAELGDRLAAARRVGAPYHLVHFDGHGQYDPRTGVGALCFERPDRKTDLIAGPRLGDLLSRLQVPLVLLEACRGAQVSDRPVFGALAPALLQGGVGSVIVFSHSVHVAAATLACERLYQGLVAGLTIGESLDEARAALLTHRARWLAPGPDPDTVDLQDWIIPQLYQGGADPALVPPGAAAPQCGESQREDLPLPGFRHRPATASKAEPANSSTWNAPSEPTPACYCTPEEAWARPRSPARPPTGGCAPAASSAPSSTASSRAPGPRPWSASSASHWAPPTSPPWRRTTNGPRRCASSAGTACYSFGTTSSRH